MSEQPMSTDAEVESTAFNDSDRVEGDHDAASVRAVMINRPRQELYDFWRDFRNLPAFMENVRSVEITGEATSWLVAGPAGSEIELVSEIVEERPGEYIAWRSLEESDIDHDGWVEFRDNPFGRGTEVRVFIDYDPPAGAIGKVIAKVLQREPRVQARRELRRFKQLMETGEIATSRAPDAAPRADRHF
ncbi:MAG: SRPBCC family protein [Pseudomonadota bacterium]|nr:SRPBCC family protein [Pseudomonadota bacterium]